MNNYLRNGLLLGTLLGSLCGCASESVDAAALTPGGTPEGGGAANAPPSLSEDEPGAEVRFDPTTPVELVPREKHEVRVVAKPPGAHTVRFALVDARDGALDQGTVVTDVSGRGSVWLTAPSSLGAFSLRAQVGSHTSTLSLSVSARPFTILEVVPRYAGRRAVSEWVVSVHVGRDCANFPAIPPDDDQLFARVAADETAEIANVPVGPALAVTVRAGQFAGGCYALNAIRGQDKLRVEVPVQDRALDLARTELDVALGVSAGDPAFLALVENGKAKLRTAFLGEAANEPSALLDAMEGALDARSRASFRVRRSELGWDASLGPNKNALNLLAAIERWVQVGQSSLLSERAFEGHLSAASNGAAENTPALRVDRIAERAASEVGAEVSGSTWTADASDALAVSALLRFRHAALVGALAREPAIAETGTLDVPQALARVVDCAGVASKLTSAGLAPVGESCDASCVASACVRALEVMWERAATLEDDASLSIAAAGSALVGNQAQAVGINGSWVGKLEVDGERRETKGTLRGAAPRYSAR